MDKSYIVTKSNKLITCNYDLSLQEQKIILTLASMVQPQDTEFKEYEFKIKDFIDLLGLKTQTKYTELPKITRELKKKVFDIREGTDIIQVSWLGGVRYKTKEGILILSLDKGLKPYMLELKELYTSYKLENVLSLKSKYSIRLYEILKSNAFKKQITIELEEIKKMLCINEKSYSVYQNVKNKVIIQAQKELKTLTDINFDFEEIKTGRKVTALKFYIHSNNIKKTPAIDKSIPGQIDMEEVLNLDSAAVADEEAIDSMIAEKELAELKAVFTKHQLSNQAICSIYEASKGNMEVIKKRYNYFINYVKKADNFIAYMISLVKNENFEEPQSYTKKNRFNNFPQTKYNFDEIEELEMKRTIKKLKESGIMQ